MAKSLKLNQWVNKTDSKLRTEDTANKISSQEFQGKIKREQKSKQ